MRTVELRRQAGGLPLVSPLEWSDSDYHDKWIFMRVHFVPLTGVILSVVVWRDEECVFHRIAFGLGPDNTPNTSPSVIVVPAGTPDLPGASYLAPQLGAIGMLNLSFLFGTQWTALHGD